MNEFAGCEFHLEVELLNSHSLGDEAFDVNLDSSHCFVVEGTMFEGSQIEVAAQLAVDSHEEIAIEGRGHAQRVVIGEQELAFGFHQIRAEEQGIAARMWGG